MHARKYKYYCIIVLVLALSCRSHAGPIEGAVIGWDRHTCFEIIGVCARLLELRTGRRYQLQGYVCNVSGNKEYQQIKSDVGQ